MKRIRAVSLSWTGKTSTKRIVSGIVMRIEVNTGRLYVDVSADPFIGAKTKRD
ncbi:MAG: hypothetical protein QMC00_01090 [Pseudomonadales bacterium]